MTDGALGTRLKNIGLNPIQDRSTALFALAAGDWTAYAADVSRRATRKPVPSRPRWPLCAPTVRVPRAFANFAAGTRGKLAMTVN